LKEGVDWRKGRHFWWEASGQGRVWVLHLIDRKIGNGDLVRRNLN